MERSILGVRLSGTCAKGRWGQTRALLQSGIAGTVATHREVLHHPPLHRRPSSPLPFHPDRSFGETHTHTGAAAALLPPFFPSLHPCAVRLNMNTAKRGGPPTPPGVFTPVSSPRTKPSHVSYFGAESPRAAPLPAAAPQLARVPLPASGSFSLPHLFFFGGGRGGFPTPE